MLLKVCLSCILVFHEMNIDHGLVVVVDGGGEKNGMEGIVVGIVGSEGMFGSGGKLNCGIDGMVGKLGSGGRCAGLGSDG